MRLSILALAATALIVAPAAAQDGDEESSKKEPKICKIDRATGSLTRRNKVCLTKSQWRELHTQTKEEIDKFGSRMGNREGAGQAGGPNGG